jgi:hypothetical protein
VFVYVIVCSETLKIYIGQHKGSDLGKYLSRKFWDANHHTSGTRSYLYNAMRKHPRESWSIYPLVSNIKTRVEVDELERHFIKVLKCQHPEVGYNICRGGEGFTGVHTPEAMRKMEEKRQVYWRNPDNHARRRQITTEMWQRPELRERMLAGLRQNPSSTRFKLGQKPSPNSGAKGPNKTSFKTGQIPWNTGAKGATKSNSGSFVKGHHLNVGRTFTSEHRQHLSASHLGQPNRSKGSKRSETARQKMRDAWERRKQDYCRLK